MICKDGSYYIVVTCNGSDDHTYIFYFSLYDYNAYIITGDTKRTLLGLLNLFTVCMCLQLCINMCYLIITITGQIPIISVTGIKLYQCYIFDMCFVVKYKPLVWLKSYTGEKPTQFVINVRSSTNLNVRRIHTMFHTEKKSYQCNILYGDLIIYAGESTCTFCLITINGIAKYQIYHNVE